MTLTPPLPSELIAETESSYLYPSCLRPADRVSVFALTPAQKVVFLQADVAGQVELPQGCILAQDATPLEAAKRELLVQTGYQASKFLKTAVLRYSPLEGNALNYCFLAIEAYPKNKARGVVEYEVGQMRELIAQDALRYPADIAIICSAIEKIKDKISLK
ncbi:NUDIX domain-containing protein [Hugenholtzia roseola]|uniref:NUDIX domain-containing protein n=1 Tax=Hugenholtzia roseola TaxID=1002 RepID=UPI0003FCF93E|nr:NUDIX domain-containing protein [Hugenholtzia roseola]